MQIVIGAPRTPKACAQAIVCEIVQRDMDWTVQNEMVAHLPDVERRAIEQEVYKLLDCIHAKIDPYV